MIYHFLSSVGLKTSDTILWVNEATPYNVEDYDKVTKIMKHVDKHVFDNLGYVGTNYNFVVSDVKELYHKSTGEYVIHMPDTGFGKGVIISHNSVKYKTFGKQLKNVMKQHVYPKLKGLDDNDIIHTIFVAYIDVERLLKGKPNSFIFNYNEYVCDAVKTNYVEDEYEFSVHKEICDKNRHLLTIKHDNDIVEQHVLRNNEIVVFKDIGIEQIEDEIKDMENQIEDLKDKEAAYKVAVSAHGIKMLSSKLVNDNVKREYKETISDANKTLKIIRKVI